MSDRWTPCSRTRTAVLHIADSSAPERGGARGHEHNGRDVQTRRGTLNRGARQRGHVAERLLDRVDVHPGHLLSLWRSGRLARSLWLFEVFGQASTAERTVRRRSRSPQTIYRQFANLAGSCRPDDRIWLPGQASGTLRDAIRTLRDRCLCHLIATSAVSRTRHVLQDAPHNPCLATDFHQIARKGRRGRPTCG